MAEAGADFIVFPPESTPASVLNEEKPGKVLRIDSGLAEDLARTIQRLPVDAVLIVQERKREATPLFIQDLMLLERIAGLTGKYLLAEFPAVAPLDDVESLWSIGVRGLILELPGKNPEERISQVRETVRRLPRTRKVRARMRATVPAMREVEPEPEEEEE
ncbi:MAG: hypothetical protein IBX68_11355 [Dehalococcoidia bacterium]|nr:hypothetical protein [Dehalococcoidia bacterium]